MNTETIWQRHHLELYFFILKKVKEQGVANDILQTSFVKIHLKKDQVNKPEKLKSWLFQIVRNEIHNHFNSKTTTYLPRDISMSTENYLVNVCCFERFINQLPELYQSPIKLVYKEGKTQAEAAQIMNISLANIKARIRRTKIILIDKFTRCCKFDVQNGKLVGEPDCAVCNL